MTDNKIEAEVKILRLKKGDLLHLALTAEDPLTKEEIKEIQDRYQKRVDTVFGAGHVKVYAVGMGVEDKVELSVIRNELTIIERIKNAVTNALMGMRVPKTIFLGKAEMAQYKRESASDRIVLAGSPGPAAYSFMTSSSVVKVEPTEADSEFCLETQTPAQFVASDS